MAVSTLEYALMAGNAYFSESTRGRENIIPFPENWILLPDYNRVEGTDGFEAAAFQNGNEIVISYAGTYSKDISGDIAADAALGTGYMNSQLLQAAEYYMAIKSDPRYKDAHITFTGHSLGGGLAALMCFYFGQAAYTFDAAPFRNAANASNAKGLYDYLDAKGYDVSQEYVATLASYYDPNSSENALPVEAYQLANLGVSDVSVKGEFLSSWLPSWLKFGNTQEITHGANDESAMNVLHSQALLIALYDNDKFRRSTISLPYLVHDIFDHDLFAADTDTNEKDFLTNLIRYEFGIPGETGSQLELLTKFGNDTSKLSSFASAGDDITEPLLKILMNYYYEKEESIDPPMAEPDEFFTQISGGLQFDMTKIADTATPSVAGYTEFRSWVINNTPAALYNDVFYFLNDAHRITVGLGNSVTATTLNDSVSDFMLSGVNGGQLNSGGGNDFLVGRSGSDTLNGGSGNDTLAGGAGIDRYEFTKGDGNDTIIDSDGFGSIYIDGELISFVHHQLGDDESIYHSHDGKFVFTKTGSDLVITRTDQWNTDKITIQNYDPILYAFGIQWDSTPASGYSGIDNKDYFFNYLAATAADASPDSLPVAPVFAPDSHSFDLANLEAGWGYVYLTWDGGTPSSYYSSTHPTVTQGNWWDVYHASDKRSVLFPELLSDSGRGNDVIYAGGVTNVSELLSDNDGVSASNSRQKVYEYGKGYRGDDYVIGSSLINYLEGNAGNDVLMGGDGDDVLLGDVVFLQAGFKNGRYVSIDNIDDPDYMGVYFAFGDGTGINKQAWAGNDYLEERFAKAA